MYDLHALQSAAPHVQCCRHWLAAPVLGVGRSSCRRSEAGSPEIGTSYPWKIGEKWDLLQGRMPKNEEKFGFHQGRMVR